MSDDELTFDEAEALGLDGTGRDLDERFPYTIQNLTPDERSRLIELYDFALSEGPRGPVELAERRDALESMLHLPYGHLTPVEVPNEGGPRTWYLDAFGTRYRGLAVDIYERPPSTALFSGDTLVAVEPTGATPPRGWYTFASVGLLHQSYVEEKMGVKGEDAAALTVLIAAMLGREPGVTG